MDPTTISWDYQLRSLRQTPGVDYTEHHHFATLPEAMWTLLAHTIPDANHYHLAHGGQRKPIASIWPRGQSEPLVELWVEPIAVDGVATTRPGLYIHTPVGTIYDFEEKLGWDLFRFKDYDGNKKMLTLTDYGTVIGVSLRKNPHLIALERDIAKEIADDGKFQLTITEHRRRDNQLSVQHFTDAYYLDNAAVAMLALFTHPYIVDRDPEPFQTRDKNAVLKLTDPDDKVVAITRMVIGKDSDAQHWPQPGLFLTFPDGLPRVNKRYGLSIKPPPDPGLEKNFIIIADFSRDYRRLLYNPGFEVVKQQLLERLVHSEVSPNEGYYLSLSSLPPHVEATPGNTPLQQTNRRAVDSFEDGLRILQELSINALDRTHAIKTHADKYLVEAILFDSGQELARLFQLNQAAGPLPPGRYLKINPDQLSTKSINALAPLLSGQPYKSDFHFLLTQPGSEKAEALKHSVHPRSLRDSGKGGPAI